MEPSTEILSNVEVIPGSVGRIHPPKTAGVRRTSLSGEDVWGGLVWGAPAYAA